MNVAPLLKKFNIAHVCKNKPEILAKNLIIASNKIKPNEMAIVIVGNKYLIKKKLENLSSSKDGMKFNFKINDIKY